MWCSRPRATSSAGDMHTWNACRRNELRDVSRSMTTSGQPRAVAGAAGDVSEDLVADPVDGPDDDDRADVRPEPVDREVRRDPLGERDHGDVDHEVEEAERHDDQ